MNPAGLLALAGMAVVLVASLIVEYQASRPEDATLPLASTRSPPAIPARAPPLPGADIQARVDDILARPLFAPTRRPPPGAAVAARGPAALPRLTAVLVSGRGKTVIFAGGADGKPVTLGEGGHIGPYVVQSIGVGEATVAGPDGAHVLRPMFTGTPGAISSAPVAAAPSILDLLRQSTPSVGVLAPPPAAPR